MIFDPGKHEKVNCGLFSRPIQEKAEENEDPSKSGISKFLQVDEYQKVSSRVESKKK